MFICLKSNYVNKLNAVARVGVGAGACICHYQLKRRRIGLIRNMQFGCIYRYEESKIIEPPISFSQIYADHVFLRHLGTVLHYLLLFTCGDGILIRKKKNMNYSKDFYVLYLVEVR